MAMCYMDKKYVNFAVIIFLIVHCSTGAKVYNIIYYILVYNL